MPGGLRGASNLIEVGLPRTNLRPASATLKRTANLVDVPGQTNAFIGFTPGNGEAGGYHDIINWQFVGDYRTIDPNPIPEPATLARLGIASLAFMRRRRR